MSAANGGNGQAPTQAAQTAGQAPQANNNGGTPAAGQTDQASDGNTQTSTNSSQMSASDYERIIGELRKENAGHRTKLKQFEDASLTEQQKRERDFTDLQTKAFEYEASLQRLHLENAGLRLAPALGISDPAAALALVQVEHAADIKYGSDGRPENLGELLKAVLKDHPALAGSAGPSSQRSASNAAAAAALAGGATNPGRQAGNGGLTIEMIRAMSPREKMARIDEINAWQRAQNQS